MEKKSAMLGAFRKMMKTDSAPEQKLKPVKGESQVQFEMLSKMLKRENEDKDEDELKTLKELR